MRLFWVQNLESSSRRADKSGHTPFFYKLHQPVINFQLHQKLKHTMFAINTTPVNISALLDTLGYQQYQQQQDNKPKIIKKVEAEDKYQIQIFKKYGNFNSYEVKVLRGTRPARHTNLVNLVIESAEDDFKKVFQFSLDDIEVSEISWEYFKDENVLVLNVPKKVRHCSDDLESLISSLFGAQAQSQLGHFGPQFGQSPQLAYQCSRGKSARELEQRRADEQLAEARRARREAKEQAKEQARRERAKVQELKRQAEEARKQQAREEEARKQQAREDEARREEARRQEARRAEIRKAETERAKRVEQEKAKRTAAVRARKEAEAKAREEAEASRSEEEHRRDILKQQEFLRLLFGGNFLPYGQFAEPQPTVPAGVSEDLMSDTDSISSETETPDQSPKQSPISENLHRSPSLEEVEDEEFVMFRKKFGEN